MLRVKYKKKNLKKKTDKRSARIANKSNEFYGPLHLLHVTDDIATVSIAQSE